jgi:DNA-binding ferritin-like protein
MAKLPSIPTGMKSMMKSSTNKEGEFITKLLHCAAQIHIYHLICKGPGSFAMHKALNELYDALPDLADGLAESVQGKYGILNYAMGGVSYDSTLSKAVPYVKEVLNYVKTTRKDICQESNFQNQIDEIETLLYSTIYKLENLS